MPYWLDQALAPQNIVVFFAVIATFLCVGAAMMPLLQKNQLSSRLKVVAKRREELQQQARARTQESKKKSVVSKSQVGLMKKAVEAVNLENLIASRELRLRLAGAGHRGPAAPVIFTFVRLVLPIGLTILAGTVLFGSRTYELEPIVKMLIVGACLPIGFFLPAIIVKSQLQARQKAFVSSFPDALDLLVICVEAGLSLEGAFQRVTEEMIDAAPVLAEEFGLTTAELAFLPERRTPLENFADRTGLDTVKGLTTSLIQSEKYGTPLGTALRVISKENRADRVARAEQKAAALSAKLTVPMIAFFLPVIFIVVLGPAVIQSLDTF